MIEQKIIGQIIDRLNNKSFIILHVAHIFLDWKQRYYNSFVLKMNRSTIYWFNFIKAFLNCCFLNYHRRQRYSLRSFSKYGLQLNAIQSRRNPIKDATTTIESPSIRREFPPNLLSKSNTPPPPPSIPSQFSSGNKFPGLINDATFLSS